MALYQVPGWDIEKKNSKKNPENTLQYSHRNRYYHDESRNNFHKTKFVSSNFKS